MTVAKVAAAALLTAMTAGVALAETNMRFGTWIPEASYPTPGFMAWAESIEAASDGEISIDLYPAGQLGNARDHYNMARDGIADITWAVPAFEPGRFPIFAVMEMPFMTTDAAGASVVFHNWYNQFADDEMSEVKFCTVTMAPQGTLNFKDKQVVKYEDLKGMRVRPAGTLLSQYLTEAGAVSVAIPASEARQAFDRGMVDGIAFPWRTLIPFGLDKAVNYHQDMIFYAVPAALVMNKGTYDGLSDKGKAAVDAHCTPEWSGRINTIWSDWESEGRRILTDQGHTIYAVPEEEQRVWVEASLPIREIWKQDVADDMDDPSAALQQLLDQLNAAGVGY